ncbi:histidine ammonia-lyase [Clostridium polynesiense]|uniref:histidine ammonia-lyase n=1 Tax=Clostridium polynesiense TaxID=1325933 RepID=UPI000590E0A1|nr:histidine ammonia-lyase [Clostridium polynesiense]
MENKVIITGEDLNLEEILLVARKAASIELSETAVKNINRSRCIVEDIVRNEKTVYGINTGFGKFSDVKISQEDCKDLQRNLILSHACGSGPLLSKEEVRTIMLLRINALAKGYSGISLNTLNTLIEMLNKGIHPCIPEKGSLGASGDLAPLAHMVLPMLGEGEAEYLGNILPASKAMSLAGIDIIDLTYKEGLALINGTQVMTAVGALVLNDALNLLKISDIAAALTMEALRGIRDAFDIRIHKLRPHLGQTNTASNILNLLQNSEYITSQGELRVQDAYTLRCIPQIHGASKDALAYVYEKITTEINSVTDNPIITLEGDVISGGNFHGQPIALALDFMGIALSELANVSERRLERLVNYQLNDLPAFLTRHGGLNSGFMITQYAAASLVSENKILAHPASVDSIPSSANQEDHVSMGTIAAVKARKILDNVYRVIATEILAACQAIDFRDKMNLGNGTSIAYRIIRENIDFIEKDTIMYKEIDKCLDVIKSDYFLSSIENKIELIV